MKITTNTAAVPSVDGKVYLTTNTKKTTDSESSGGGDVTATVMVRDLVQKSPFVDHQGRFYVGSRTASAAAIDRDTGEILRVVGGAGAGAGAGAGSNNVAGEGLYHRKNNNHQCKEETNDDRNNNDHNIARDTAQYNHHHSQEQEHEQPSLENRN
eukprot:9911243-Ditylum_brightwellii.AAC.1